MKFLQNLVLIALFAVAITSCQKETIMNSTDLSTNTAINTLPQNNAHSRHKCDSKAHMDKNLLDPAYRARQTKNKALFEKSLRARSQSRSACSSPLILPVAIHYQGTTSNDRACLLAVAQAAIASTNADFRGENVEINNKWIPFASQYYPNVNVGNTCIQFQIASKNHPSGYGLQNGDLAVTINQTNDDYLANWAGYINIFVANIDGLGYSPLGGDGLGDGLAVHLKGFSVNDMQCGNVKSYPENNLGRTLTHELGHYFNLEHIWGDEGGCNQDDNVADTPNQADANSGCPTLGTTRGCNAEALHMNHMDYPDDACVYMFTAGQSRRMEAWANSVLARNLKTNVLGTANEGGTTTGNTTPNNGGTEETTEEEETDTNTGEEMTSKITMKVTLDDYGSETTFYVLDSEGYILKEYGPFEDEQGGTVIKKSIELPRGVYTFLIEDSYGDGICCEYGRGKWRLLKDGTRIKGSNGNFGFYEEYDFAVGSARMSGDLHRKDEKGPVALKVKTK